MKTDIIAYGLNRSEKDFAHIPYVPGKVFIDTSRTREDEFLAMLSCLRDGMIVGLVSMGDLSRGMGQVKKIEAIKLHGGGVRVFEPEKAKSERADNILTDDQREAACSIWGNSALSEASRLHRIHEIDGMPKLAKHQLHYQCVTRAKRQQKQ